MYINRLHGLWCMCNEKIGDIQREIDVVSRCMYIGYTSDIQLAKLLNTQICIVHIATMLIYKNNKKTWKILD